MDNIKDNTIQIKRLTKDTEYFNNVFKKIEKTVSVIFYVLSEIDIKDKQEIHAQSVRNKALETHELSLSTLAAQPHQVQEKLSALQLQLVSLQSALHVLSTIRILPADIAGVLDDQLDALLRYLTNHYLQDGGVSIADLSEQVVSKSAAAKPTRSTGGSSAPTQRQRRVNIPAGDISTDAYLVYSQLTDRAERIKTVLEAKPESSVKDIAEVITDVSEKTIQRELNSLIEKGQVRREGERRWSKYSVIK